MRIDRFASLATASAIMLALLFLHRHPLPPGWDKVAHFVVYAVITALLWHGTAGQVPFAVLAAVIAFAALDEVHQIFMPGRAAELADFIADAAAAGAVCGLLSLTRDSRRKSQCVELSEP